ncbi:ATP-binding cassette domain-containing protein [Nakamurella sp. YIM 132087]|uniref:ATP-binding cassette domain-containing protein n=1 Tax=Nakamurella alba TaxID=2665158 RepID=A0A7K1FK86_9ACTN|nr:ABC transporter ATP-binding protein [Nakamurella alba]MTD13274.1 ATP-binding cassette domain-containing protein [Nakamurella alba]
MTSTRAGRDVLADCFRWGRRGLLGAAVCGVIAELAVVAMPMAVGRAVEQLPGDGSVGVLLWPTALVLLGVAAAVLTRVEQRGSWLTGARVVGRLRCEIGVAVLDPGPVRDPGEVASRIQRDGDHLWDWMGGLVGTTRALAGLAGILVAALLLDPVLGTIAVIATVASVGGGVWFAPRYQARSLLLAEAHGRAASRLQELVAGLPAARGLGVTPELLRRNRSGGADIADRAVAAAVYAARWDLATRAVPLLGIAAGLALRTDGGPGPGGLLAWITWMVLLSATCGRLVSQQEVRRTAAASADRLAELLAAPGSAAPAHLPERPQLLSGSITENIAVGRAVSVAEIRLAADRAALQEDVERLPDGFDTVVGDGGRLLSGGQRQRLALARELLDDPPELVLAGALDAVDAVTVRRILDRAAADGRRLTTTEGAA